MKNVVLLLALALVCYPVLAVDGNLGNGNGSQANPYLIEDINDFHEFCSDPNYWDDYTRLEVDLDLSMAGTYSQAPIAPDLDNTPNSDFNGTPFTGYFDGNSHIVRNLTISGMYYCGLIGRTGSLGYVANLGVENCQINSSGLDAGGLCGTNEGVITNCYSTGHVGDYDAGIFCGHNEGIITHSYSTCLLSEEARTVAGFCSRNDGTIINCYSTGDLWGKYTAGFCDWNSRTGVITNCYSTGESSGTTFKNGFCWSNDGTITSCFWDVEAAGWGSSGSINEGAIGKTTAEMQTLSTFTDAGWDFSEADGDPADWTMPTNDYPQVVWTSAPYQIRNTNDWQMLMNDPNLWSAYFILRCDLDLSNLTLSPIGNSDTPFTGIFDGGEHVISNVYINLPGSDYVGLFGNLVSGQIINLGIDNIDVLGNKNVGGLVGSSHYSTVSNCMTSGVVNGHQYIGGLVGQNYHSKIFDSSSTVSVNSEDQNLSDEYIGGLVGASLFGTIENCHTEGQVISDGKRVGGLVGGNGSSSVVIDCYVIGHIQGRGIGLGGLCGYNSGSIDRCYSKGTMSGGGIGGGLCGINENSIINCYSTSNIYGADNAVGGFCSENNGNIKNCYSTGDATGIGWGVAGGFCVTNTGSIRYCYSTGSAWGAWASGPFLGWGNMGSIDACFWDVDTSGIGSSGDNHYGAIGKTTAEMQALSTFTDAGWDFSEADGDPADWKMLLFPKYPRLDWDMVGTEGNPFPIQTPSDWQALTSDPNYWSSHFVLTADINLEGLDLLPVGNQDNKFTGVMDGAGHVISNVTMHLPDSNDVGLFGYITGEIKNLGVVDVDIVGNNRVGGLLAFGGYISNCYVAGKVHGQDEVGLLSGGSAEVYGCSAVGQVSGYNYVGGLVGGFCNTMIKESYAIGQVTGSTNVGGLCGGTFLGWISNCYAGGEVTGQENIGGLCGTNDYAGVISNSYSTATVTGSINTGGFCGARLSSGKIYSSFWDIDSSGMTDGVGNLEGEPIPDWCEVTGLTTEQMHLLSTFTDAGWDFVGETSNGSDDVWMMLREGEDYPRLAWQEIFTGDVAGLYGVDIVDFVYLANYWGLADCDGVDDCGRADIDASGDVGISDLAEVADNWLHGSLGGI